MLADQSTAMALLKKYGIAFPETLLLKSGEKLPDSAPLAFPAVLKIDSPEVMHKTDAGFVFANLRSHAEVREKMLALEQAAVQHSIRQYRMIVQRMVQGIELITGMKRDPTFGPVVVFGLGGIFVEAVNDVSMRIAPLAKRDCLEMLAEIRGSRLLRGYRGLPAVDTDQLVALLMAVSSLSMRERDITEMDFNPVIANGSEVVVVDARMVNNA